MLNSRDIEGSLLIYYWTEKLELKTGIAGSMIFDLTVALTEEGICWISLGEGGEEEELLRKWASRWYSDSSLVEDEVRTLQARTQMKEYFSGKRRQFDLKLAPKGTPFQQKVWEELVKIPYGETRSYEEIARAVNSPKGQRAVGMANHNNTIIVVIPCHRVIGKNGSLTGYGGGLELKQRLLELEGTKGD